MAVVLGLKEKFSILMALVSCVIAGCADTGAGRGALVWLFPYKLQPPVINTAIKTITRLVIFFIELLIIDN